MVQRRSIGFAMITVSLLFSYKLYHSRLWSVIHFHNALVLGFFALTLVLYGFSLLLRTPVSQARFPVHSVITFACALLMLCALGSGEGFVAFDQAGTAHQGNTDLLNYQLVMLEIGISYLFSPLVLWLPISRFLAIVRKRTAWWFEVP